MPKNINCERIFIFVFGCLSGLGCFTSLHAIASKVQKKQCFRYGHCRLSPDSVHDLECFKELGEHLFNCTWKSAGQPAEKTSYTITIEQPGALRNCRNFSNISTTSKLLTLYTSVNLSAYVVDLSNNESNCTKAVFTGSPDLLVRCSPTNNVSFQRHPSQLEIRTSWKEKKVKKYVVQIRETGSQMWRKLEPVYTEKSSIVRNLTSSAYYDVQVHCETNDNCRQCPWSSTFTVPPALTEEPVIELKVVPQEKGKRLVIIHWKLQQQNWVVDYAVTVTKESGELSQRMRTQQSSMSLIISGSAYNISIEAFSGAGTSPSGTTVIKHTEDSDFLVSPKVTFDRTFIVSWERRLTKPYICFSVEWRLKGQKPFSESFHTKKESFLKLTPQGSWESYKKYIFLLHGRLDKDTCNLKTINNSEVTFGRAEAYAKEGTPLSPPVNITCSKVTLRSLTIQWSPVAEDDLRGLLLGYTIYYSENTNRNQSSVNVSSQDTNYTLSKLKQHTAYTVQMSAFTSAGAGEKSLPLYLKTKAPDTRKFEKAAMIGIAVLVTGILLCCLVLKRFTRVRRTVTKFIWPSIPNPGNSNAIQKIDGADMLDVSEPTSMGVAQVKESDGCSLHIIENQEESETETMSPLLVQETSEPAPVSAQDKEEDRASGGEAEPSPVPTSSLPVPPCPSGYTTMALFRQCTAERPAEGVVPTVQPGAAVQTKPSQDYVRQAASLSTAVYHNGSTCTDITII